MSSPTRRAGAGSLCRILPIRTRVHIKTRNKRVPGISAENVFSHPDYTVGSGIPLLRSPDQPLARVMDYTIGRDFHPATKTFGIQL